MTIRYKKDAKPFYSVNWKKDWQVIQRSNLGFLGMIACVCGRIIRLQSYYVVKHRDLVYGTCSE